MIEFRLLPVFYSGLTHIKQTPLVIRLLPHLYACVLYLLVLLYKIGNGTDSFVQKVVVLTSFLFLFFLIGSDSSAQVSVKIPLIEPESSFWYAHLIYFPTGFEICDFV